MTANTGEETLDSLVQKIADLDHEIRRAAMSMSDKINAVAMESIKNTRIGGGVFAQFLHRPGNCPTKRAVIFLEGHRQHWQQWQRPDLRQYRLY